MPTLKRYRGRFAPSPSGPLHFGSLIAAVASYLQAHSQQGEWWLRVEDIDPPREAPGARDAILRSLEAFGLQWDGEVRYQKARQERYAEALVELQKTGLLYRCSCSRQQIARATARNEGPLRYPGTCRDKNLTPLTPHALRIDTRQVTIRFDDAIQGRQQFDLEREAGDFVLRRADGLFSYQLAVAIDDAEQGMTEVVRGMDLLDSTPRQIYLQQLLNLPTPSYAHHPVAVDAGTGRKLSKQTFARAINDQRPVETLWQALRFLGQRPPEALRETDLADFWEWAKAHWQLKFVPQTAVIEINTDDAPETHAADT